MSDCNTPTALNREVMVMQKILTMVFIFAQMIYTVIVSMGQTKQTKQNEQTEQTEPAERTKPIRQLY